MAYFSICIGAGQEDLWEKRAAERKALVLKYLDNGGLLYDYNFVQGKFSNIFSVASLYPLFCGMVDDEYAKKAVDNLYRLEADYGLFGCEKNDITGDFQWNYPMGCGCLELIAVKALDNYGYKDAAMRLALKYTALVEKVYSETGSLWEKYNVVDGNINVIRRATMPSMKGRIAGSYLMLKKHVDSSIF